MNTFAQTALLTLALATTGVASQVAPEQNQLRARSTGEQGAQVGHHKAGMPQGFTVARLPRVRI